METLSSMVVLLGRVAQKVSETTRARRLRGRRSRSCIVIHLALEFCKPLPWVGDQRVVGLWCSHSELQHLLGHSTQQHHHRRQRLHNHPQEHTPETATTAAAAAHYGEIVHPAIDDIAVMITDYFDNVGPVDLRGAYHLFSYHPDEVGLFAMRLSDNLVYLQSVGIYDRAGKPAALQVVTRAVQWKLANALHGQSIGREVDRKEHCHAITEINHNCLRLIVVPKLTGPR